MMEKTRMAQQNTDTKSGEPLDQLLRFDPLAAAEDLTGNSYKDDESTAWLGFLLAQDHGRNKERALLAGDDTVLSNDLARYLSIIGEMGFEKVLEDDFSGHGNKPEKFFVFARRDGLLLTFDTFNSTRVNGGKVAYNWRPASDDAWSDCISSGHHTASGVWVGYHDCREALRHNLAKMAAGGAFVTPWVERPFLWLLHYQDTKAENYSYEAINAERISRLPAWVVEFMTPALAKAST